MKKNTGTQIYFNFFLIEVFSPYISTYFSFINSSNSKMISDYTERGLYKAFKLH